MVEILIVIQIYSQRVHKILTLFLFIIKWRVKWAAFSRKFEEPSSVKRMAISEGVTCPAIIHTLFK